MPEFEIKFVVTRQQALEAHKAESAAYKEHVKEADSAAKMVEAASNREADAKIKAGQKALTAEEAASKAAEELTRRQNAAKVKAIADSMDADRKAKLASDEMRRQALEADKKAARDALEATKARIKAEREERKKLDDEIKRQSKEQADGMKSAESAASGFLGVLTNIAGATLGVSSLSTAIGYVVDAFNAAKQAAMDAGKFVEDYRQNLKELAFLKGQPGATAPIVQGDLDFRSKTLQDQNSSRATQEAFLNTAAISIDSGATRAKMSKQEAEGAMVFAGRMQSMAGGSGDAWGKLAGIIPSTESKERVSAEDVKRRLFQMTQIGSIGAASPAQFAEQMAGTAYLTQTGAYKDLARQAAVGSAISLSAPGEVGVGLEQLHKMSAGGLVNQSKGPGAERSPSEYLKGLGAHDKMDDLQILDLMMRDVASKNLSGNEMTTYLAKQGFDNGREVDRFRQLYGRRQDLYRTLLPMADKMPTGQEADEGFNKFVATPSGMSQKSNVAQDRAKFGLGAGAQEYYAALQKQAHASLSARGAAWGDLESYKGSTLGLASLETEMRAILSSEGSKAGLPWQYDPKKGGAQIDPLNDLSGGLPGSQSQAGKFYQHAQEIAAAGGSPLGDNSRQVMDMNKNLKDQYDTLVKSEAHLAKIAAAIQPPPVAVARPGGRNALPTR